MRRPEDELGDLEDEGLRRRLVTLRGPQGREVAEDGGGPLLNFSSNDYLGLASDERIVESFREHLLRHGAGAGASRLVCGTLRPHRELEERLAAFKGSEAALTFTSGFATATGVLPALCGKGDFLLLDKLCHASLIDGARLSGATLRVFPHNRLEKLESHLLWARRKAAPGARIVVVTESVFSMDGDLAPLAEIVELKEKHGAWLLVDEAHAFGVIGPGGRGLGAELALDDRIDLRMGTFSKAAGLSGGYLCASRAVVDLLVNRARSFIYSTAPSPALAATIADCLILIGGTEGDRLRERLWSNLAVLEPGAASAILPLVIGDNGAALAAAGELREKGFLVPAIRYPTVPRGAARLRVTMSAAHAPGDVRSLRDALSGIPALSPAAGESSE